MTEPRITHVKNPCSGRYERRSFVYPVVIACCPSCDYRATSVGVEASDEALWQHTVAVHLAVQVA